MVVFVILALGAGGALSRAQDSAMREVGRRDPAAAMPDGEGKGLTLAACTQCHSLNSTVQQRKTAADWERTVRDMVARGAQVQPEEIRIIADYLAKSYPPGATSINAGNRGNTGSAGGENARRGAASAMADPNSTAALPEGAAKSLVARACVECHGLDRITTGRKDEAGWRASVKDMIRLGAMLRPDEESALIAYLAQHFSRQPAAAAVSGGETAPANRPADPAQALPDGEGKGLILATCVQCHALRAVTGQRKNAGAWRRTVDDMIARGAQLNQAEAEVAARYLAEHLAGTKK